MTAIYICADCDDEFPDYSDLKEHKKIHYQVEELMDEDLCGTPLGENSEQ